VFPQRPATRKTASGKYDVKDASYQGRKWLQKRTISRPRGKDDAVVQFYILMVVYTGCETKVFLTSDKIIYTIFIY
jgi:hypothetical protein